MSNLTDHEIFELNNAFSGEQDESMCNDFSKALQQKEKRDCHDDFIRIVNKMKMLHGWTTQKIAEHYSVPESLVIDALKETKNDPVNHPSHYTDGKIEVIDFITDKNLNFQLGNAVKYICRAGKKDPNKTIEDLKKAQWYLNQWIDHLEKDELNEPVKKH